nr:hypothetical protein [Halorubrum sp. Ea1]
MAVEQTGLGGGGKVRNVIEMCVRQEDGVDITVVDSRLCKPVGDAAGAVDEMG